MDVVHKQQDDNDALQLVTAQPQMYRQSLLWEEKGAGEGTSASQRPGKCVVPERCVQTPRLQRADTSPQVVAAPAVALVPGYK
jgi:hypothetical protein